MRRSVVAWRIYGRSEQENVDTFTGFKLFCYMWTGFLLWISVWVDYIFGEACVQWCLSITYK